MGVGVKGVGCSLLWREIASLLFPHLLPFIRGSIAPNTDSMKSCLIAAVSEYLFKNRPDNRADMRAFKAGTVKADMHICHLGWFIFWPVGGLHVMSLRTSFMACYCHLAIGRSLVFVCLFVFYSG